MNRKKEPKMSHQRDLRMPNKRKRLLRIILKLGGSLRDSHPPHSLGIIYSDWLANEVSQSTEKLSSVKLVDGTKTIGNRYSKISVSVKERLSAHETLFYT